MINCILGAFDLHYIFFTRGIQITSHYLPAGTPFVNPHEISYLPELLHLLVEVWIKLLGHVLHP